MVSAVDFYHKLQVTDHTVEVIMLKMPNLIIYKFMITDPIKRLSVLTLSC